MLGHETNIDNVVGYEPFFKKERGYEFFSEFTVKL